MIRQFSYLSLFACLFISLPCSAQLTPGFSAFGDSIDDRMGNEVDCAGDVNNDGYDDIIVGILADDNGGFNTGSARVYSGFDGSLIYNYDGSSTIDSLGTDVAGLGDLNNDGYDDFIIGTPRDDNTGFDSGSAQVFSGIDGSLLYIFNGASGNDELGRGVGCAGDVNGDGTPDIIVGSPFNDFNGFDTGSAYVYSGATGALIYTFRGDSPADHLGGSPVGTAGDVDADGMDDIIIGIRGADANEFQSGCAKVYSGATGALLYSISGNAEFEEFGYSASTAGDVNHDGHDDFIVGAPFNENNGPFAGNVKVYSGASGALLYSIDGDAAGDRFGESVAPAGDFNRDGFDDFLVGASYDDNGLTDSGSVRVYSGLDGSMLHEVNGTTASSVFGTSVAAGDINADGFNDVIVGAAFDDTNGVKAGSVRVFHGPVLPAFTYDSPLVDTDLILIWLPQGGLPNALQGTIICGAATPGALGLFGVSLAPTNSTIFGLALLIANDPINLVDMGSFGFDGIGQIIIPSVSRQNAFLAGTHVFIQFFETSPIPSSSNGIAMLLAP